MATRTNRSIQMAANQQVPAEQLKFLYSTQSGVTCHPTSGAKHRLSQLAIFLGQLVPCAADVRRIPRLRE